MEFRDIYLGHLQLVFHHNHHAYAFQLQTILTYPLQYMHLRSLLRKFLKQYEPFKKACEETAQNTLIEQSPYLKELYFKSAQQFVQENNITELVHKYLSEVLYATTFLPLHKLNAFTFLQLSLPVIISYVNLSWNLSFSRSR